MLKNIFSKVLEVINANKNVYHGAPLTFSKDGFVEYEEIKTASGIFNLFPAREPVGYTVRNQNGSGSCVAQTTAKMLEVWDYVNDGTLTVYSATPIYQSRSNKPSGGMIGTEALDNPIQKGIYLESDVPSQNMSDSQMDLVYIDLEKKQKIRANKKVLIPVDFYKVAESIKTGNCVMVWFKCGMTEWNQDIPTGLSNSEVVRHSVTAVDAISYKGIEYIIIEDSWGKWLKFADVPLKEGQRAITKEFFDKHCYFAGAFTEFIYNESPTGFKFHFDKILVLGDRGEEVINLQDALKSEGLFPANQKSTGYYGDLTRRAVFDFQVRYKVAPMEELQVVRGKRVGSKTIAKLNELFDK